MLEIEHQRSGEAAVMELGGQNRRTLAAFWLLGLLNNSAYVIMLAGANSISAAAVGLVYLAAVGPSLLCKASAPYWFHRVRYTTRMHAAAVLMAASYTTVALSSSRGWQLLGVVFASLQGGLGEASCLALTSHYSGRPAITMWSSGTGFAGVFGYAWVALLHLLGGLSFRVTLLLANSTTLAWLAAYHCLLDSPEERAAALLRHDSSEGIGVRSWPPDAATATAPQWPPPPRRREGGGRQVPVVVEAATAAAVAAGAVGGQEGEAEEEERRQLLAASPDANSARLSTQQQQQQQQQQHQRWPGVPGSSSSGGGDWKPCRAERMGWRERLQRTAALWPYMAPLMLVYFAEYAMQSGTWTAVGFPVTSAAARHRFYVFANWCYQGGVFVSRSSGMLWQASRRALWAMPVAQVGFLAFFLLDAIHHWWYDAWLLVPCFVTGLLGGAVYVNAFTLISAEVPAEYREFSLGAASLADSLGVAAADACGILIQGCLFRINGLPGADFKC